MSTTGAQRDRWKQATQKEELRARCFANKKKVAMQLLVFSLKPMSHDSREEGARVGTRKPGSVKVRTMKASKSRILRPTQMHIFSDCS